MVIFKENKEIGLQCGLNDDGDLFLGDNESGGTMKDTIENRVALLREFDNIIERNKRLGFRSC